MNMPHRMKVKYFIQQPEEIVLSKFIPLFHRWIQEQSGDDLFIDVADYQHVPQGPGVLLIGHEADYALDMGNNRPGLMYIRKRQGLSSTDDLPTSLQQMLRRVLLGCQAIEKSSSFETPIQFRTDEIELTFSDRLNTPNQAQEFARVQSEIAPILEAIYGDTPIHIEQANSADPRYTLTIRVTASGAPSLGKLLERVS